MWPNFFWAIGTNVIGLFGKSLKGDLSHRYRVTLLAREQEVTKSKGE